jgi:hypothetical protein
MRYTSFPSVTINAQCSWAISAAIAKMPSSSRENLLAKALLLRCLQTTLARCVEALRGHKIALWL